MFSAHFQIMPKFDNMVLSDLVLFKDGMYFIYSLTETLSNYRDYSIFNKIKNSSLFIMLISPQIQHSYLIKGK